MNIGLIDVDGHNFPNLALMRISAYHKARGDTVNWWFGIGEHYDIVYMSKIFSDTYCADKRDLFGQYIETRALIDFSQGLDIRLLNEEDLSDLEKMRIKNIHFAWDNPKDDLKKRFEWYAQNAKRKPKGRYGTVYILTNFENVSPEEHVERALYRIETVTALKYDPYLMIYNKPNAPQILKDLQRWCNNKIIFNSERDFRKYRGRKA